MILTLVLSSVLAIGSPAEMVNSEVIVPVAEDVALLIFEAEPCERISEIVEELRSDRLAVYRVDVAGNSNLARQCQVWETPHWVMLVKGHAWQQLSGCQSTQVLRSWFQEAAAESQGTRIRPSAERVDSSFDELRTAHLEKEYAAPIPDSLVTYDVVDASGNAGQIVLEKLKPEETLERLPGPTWRWPHVGCPMCVGNALILKGFDEQYLRGLTYEQWGVLWDNVHNKPDLVKGKPPGEGYIGYEAGGGYSSRPRLLERLFGRRRR